VTRGDNPEQIIPYFINSFDQALSSYGYYRQLRNLDKEKTAFFDVSGKYTFGDMLTGEAKAGAKYRYKNRSKLSEEFDSQDYLTPLSTYYDLIPTGQSVGSNGAAIMRIPQLAGTRFEYMTINASKATVTDFMNSPYEGRNIFDKYYLYPMMDPDAIREWYRITQNGCEAQYAKKNGAANMYQKNWAAVADYYDILERTSSAYVMNTLNYEQLVTFIAGFRVEREQNNYKSIWVKDPVSGFSTNPNWAFILASHDETVYCPNFNLTMRPTDYMNVRFAAYKAIARPDFNMRLNRYFYSTSSTPRTLDAGNPNLVAAQAWNYETNTSFFGNDFGLITLSAFYKNISHMFHTVSSASTSGTAFIRALGANWPVPTTTDEYALTMPYNSNKPTKVWGFEFEHQARFEFLPGYLKNIVLSYNCSLVKSETYVYKTKKQYLTQTDTIYVHGKPVIQTVYLPYDTFFEYKTKLEGQPEFYGNVSLGYDIAGFSIRLSYFYQSRYTTSYSIDGFNDSLQVAFGRMDLALKYEYDKHISVFVNVNNLTDAEEKTIRRNRIDGWEVVTSSQRYGLTGDVGVRYTF
jgi:TonB-dependent receptor